MNETRVKIDANIENMELQINGNTGDILKVYSAVVTSLMEKVSDLKGMDKDHIQAARYAMLSTAIVECGIDVDDFCKEHKEAMKLKEKLSGLTDAIPQLKEIKGLLEDLKRMQERASEKSEKFESIDDLIGNIKDKLDKKEED